MPEPTWYRADFGGGLRVYVDGASTATISDNLFQDNWGATGHQCVGHGGGVWVQGTATLGGNHIIDNHASQYPDWGGYLPVYRGGVYTYVYSTVTMTNNILVGNQYFDEDDNPFAPDYFSDRGAIHVGGQATPQNTRLYLYHNTIADNQSPAVFVESAGITMSHNNIFAEQSTGIELERDRTGAGSSQPVALVGNYTLWYPPQDIAIVDGAANTSNDFVGDPDFTSDYHLNKNAAAIDRGPGAGVTNNIDDHPRPVNSLCDLGADEFISNTATITDGYGTVMVATAWVNAKRVYLPLATRQFP